MIPARAHSQRPTTATSPLIWERSTPAEAPPATDPADLVTLDSSPPDSTSGWLMPAVKILGAAAAVAVASPAMAAGPAASYTQTLPSTGHKTYFGTLPGGSPQRPIKPFSNRTLPGSGRAYVRTPPFPSSRYSVGSTGAYTHQHYPTHSITVGPGGATYHGRGYSVGPWGAVNHRSIHRGNGYSVSPSGVSVHRNFGNYSITVGPRGSHFHFK